MEHPESFESVPHGAPMAPLNQVIVTEKLAARLFREPDQAAENRALVSLNEILANRSRHQSPCGEVVACKAPILMHQPVRHYPYVSRLGTHFEDVLLVPFYKGNDVIGTVWAVLHDQSLGFNQEDLRRLQSLSQFASTAVISFRNIS